MTMTGLSVFDTTTQKTNDWVNDVAASLGWDDKHRAFQGLRNTLHVLRDRLTTEEAAHLGAQLPILLAGFYYEGWRPVTNPSKERSKDEFLAGIREYFQTVDPNVDAEQVARATFKVLANRVSTGEIEKVKGMMPKAIEELWPESVAR